MPGDSDSCESICVSTLDGLKPVNLVVDPWALVRGRFYIGQEDCIVRLCRRVTAGST